jgi:hypothetical protein
VFTAYLINIGIRNTLSPQRMGITKQGLLKYYLGLEFEFSENENEDIIREHYEPQLEEIRKKFTVANEEESDIENSMSVPHEEID